MVNAEFGKIGVLLGGPSTERDISLKSGKAVYNVFLSAGLDVVEIDIVSDDLEENAQLIKNSHIDVAFIALHGHFGEDGKIQALLERLDIPYTGSGPEASSLAMHKVASRQIFQRNGLNVPRYKVFSEIKAAQEPKMPFPLVVKPASHGSSIGLSIVNDKEQLLPALEVAFQLDRQVIVEEYIKGREFTVGIFGQMALPVIEIKPKNIFFDFAAKYQPGLTEYIVPAKIDEDIKDILQKDAFTAHQSLGCFGFSRVDMLLNSSDNQVYILELNSIPGLTENSLLPKAARAAGIDFLDLCKELVRQAYARQKNKAAY